jgi:hypothetical protein
LLAKKGRYTANHLNHYRKSFASKLAPTAWCAELPEQGLSAPLGPTGLAFVGASLLAKENDTPLNAGITAPKSFASKLAPRGYAPGFEHIEGR